MPRERRADGELRRLGIAGFADEQNVGILPQDCAERRGERQADLFADLRLPDAHEFVFHRVFQRVDNPALVIECVEGRVQSRGLARTGRPGEVNKSGRSGQCSAERLGLRRREPELREILARHRLVEEPDNETLAVDSGQRAETQVKPTAPLPEHGASVLRQAFFRDVHPTENLASREQCLALRNGQSNVAVHFAIEPEAHDQPVLLGFEMNVARALGGSGAQNRV